ncbi:MAG: hypothetical protein ABSG87_05795 [Verrucomicrobiota bacterium]|jgi:hypothetical protein
MKNGNVSFFDFNHLACELLRVAPMSSFEEIYKKMAAREPGAADWPDNSQKFDPAKHISPVVAHDLNNLLTVIQGHADRMLFRHGEEPTLAPHLKVISEAAKRAAAIICEATPSMAAPLPKQNPAQQQQAAL